MAGTPATRVTVAWMALVAACGEDPAGPAFELRARVGTYDDGSGRIGLAMLATLRDASGAGPATPWALALRDGAGPVPAAADYDAPGSGSYSTTWWPGVAPSPGRYQVSATRGSEAVGTTAALDGAGTLPLPEPALAVDASRIDWPPVPGAAAYSCRVHAGGAVQLETMQAAPGCDLSALPPGGYTASVLAFSADLLAVRASSAQLPPLPGRFDVSEARLALVRPDGVEPGTLIRLAGGAYDDGIGARSLAIWASIADAQGAATAEAWTVEVVGPNLPAGAPLTFTYWASFPRLVVWAPGVPASPGTYTATATSAGGTAVVARFTVGSPAWLDLPLGVTAVDGAQGSAHVSWDPVAGAASYLASAYDSVTGAPVASQWVAVPAADFPQGTFLAGLSYDVFVAASDADMVGGTVPTQISVAENVLLYASFVAR